jgi:ABC-type sulfate transport system permease component
MKSMHGGKSQLLRATTLPYAPGRSRRFDDLKERAMDAVTLSAMVAVVVALYAVMFMALYCWSHHAPIFPPDSAAGQTMMEPIP